MPFALEGEKFASGGLHADNVAPSLLGGLILCPQVLLPDVRRVPVPDGRVAHNVDNAAIPAKPEKAWYWWAIFKETPPIKRIMAFDAKTARPLCAITAAATARPVSPAAPTTICPAPGARLRRC